MTKVSREDLVQGIGEIRNFFKNEGIKTTMSIWYFLKMERIIGKGTIRILTENSLSVQDKLPNRTRMAYFLPGLDSPALDVELRVREGQFDATLHFLCGDEIDGYLPLDKNDDENIFYYRSFRWDNESKFELMAQFDDLEAKLKEGIKDAELRKGETYF